MKIPSKNILKKHPWIIILAFVFTTLGILLDHPRIFKYLLLLTGIGLFSWVTFHQIHTKNTHSKGESE